MFFYRDLAVRAIERAEFRIEQTDEIPDFRDGGDSGFSAALRNSLFDGDGGRQAVELVKLRFFELFGELPGISGHRVEETALAFGE